MLSCSQQAAQNEASSLRVGLQYSIGSEDYVNRQRTYPSLILPLALVRRSPLATELGAIETDITIFVARICVVVVNAAAANLALAGELDKQATTTAQQQKVASTYESPLHRLNMTS